MNTMQIGADLHKNVPPNWYYQSIRIDTLQRFWHRRRFEEVARQIEPVKGKILDIGCADGMFTKVVLDKSGAPEIMGIDVVKTSIAWAKKHWANNGKMKFMVMDAHSLKFESEAFAAVVALEMLEHVVDPEKVLAEIKRVLKKGGYAILLVPSDNFLFRFVWFLWLHFYPRGWVWRETHIQTYRNDYLAKLVKRAGFKVEINKTFNLGMLNLVKVRKE